MYTIRRKINYRCVAVSFNEYKNLRAKSEEISAPHHLEKRSMTFDEINRYAEVIMKMETANPREAMFNTQLKFAEIKLNKFEELWPGEYEIIEFNDFSY